MNNDEILLLKEEEIKEIKLNFEEYKTNASEIESFLESEIKTRDEKMNLMEKEIKNLKNNNDSLTIKNDSLKAEINRLLLDLENDKKKFYNYEQKQIQNQKAIVSIEEENRKLIEDLETERKNKCINESVANLEEIDELNRKLEEANQEIISMKEKFDIEIEGIVNQALEKEINDTKFRHEQELNLLKEELNNKDELLNKYQESNIKESISKSIQCLTIENNTDFNLKNNLNCTIENKDECIQCESIIDNIDKKIIKDEIEEKFQMLLIENENTKNKILELTEQFKNNEEQIKYEKDQEIIEIRENYELEISKLNKLLTFVKEKYEANQKQFENSKNFDCRSVSPPISEEIEIIEENLAEEYEQKVQNMKEILEKTIKEKYDYEFQEKIDQLKNQYESEIDKMKTKIKEIEKGYENKEKNKLSSEYEKKLLEIKNHYENEILILTKQIKEIDDNNDKKNENFVKQLKKSHNVEKKNLQDKIEDLINEKNLLIEEKKAWEEFFKKNEKSFEGFNIPSFFPSNFITKNENSAEKKTKITDFDNETIMPFLYLGNSPKNQKIASQNYRIEKSIFYYCKNKKTKSDEKIYNFSEIFTTNEQLYEIMGNLVEIDKEKNKKIMLILNGPKKTKKKQIQIDIIQNLITNFLEKMKRNNNENELEANNYEFRLTFDQLPNDSNTKDLTLNLSAQFYLNQIPLHYNKQINLIENSFAKFKSVFTKRNYLNKSEKKIRVFKIDIISCSEKHYIENTFYVISSNKIITTFKSNINKYELLEEIINLNNQKTLKFPLLKDFKKIFCYCLDLVKNQNDVNPLQTLSIFNKEISINNINSLNEQEIIEIPKKIDESNKDKKEIENFNLFLVEKNKQLEKEKKDLLDKITSLQYQNTKIQDEMKQISLNLQKLSAETNHNKNKTKISLIRSSNLNNSKIHKEKQKIDKFLQSNKINQNNKKKNFEVLKTEITDDEDDEPIIYQEEEPRPFPGKFRIQSGKNF